MRHTQRVKTTRNRLNLMSSARHLAGRQVASGQMTRTHKPVARVAQAREPIEEPSTTIVATTPL